jgi:hypothetical protein
MIQRIQSIFLLISSLGFFALFGVPFATSSVAIPQLFADKQYDIQDSPLLLVLCILGGLISSGAIFLFNNRPLQLKLSYIATVLSVLLPVLAILLVLNEGTGAFNADKISDKAGIYLPVVSLIFSILAAKYIRKDDDTVRSMDRLR